MNDYVCVYRGREPAEIEFITSIPKQLLKLVLGNAKAVEIYRS